MLKKKGILIGYKWFKKRCIQKNLWVSRVGLQGVLMDYILINRRAKENLLDVNMLRVAASGTANHNLVEKRVKVVGEFRKRRTDTTFQKKR